MDNRIYSKLFHTRISWRICYTIGILVMVIAFLLKHNLFYLYVYFLIAGLISLANSFRRYAIITSKDIILFKGSFLKSRELKSRELKIPWSFVSKISNVKVKKKYLTKNMGIDTGLFAPTSLEDEEGILISLSKSIDDEHLINQNNKLKIKFDINHPEDRMVYIDDCPEGGVNNFLFQLNRFGGDKVDVLPSPSFKARKGTNLCIIFDICLFIASVTLLIISLMRDVLSG